ncbi:MAG: tetratricopeptide repeat protein [Bacteroidia bacterium]|nr:tetratricopeptide repeat protein [Bacteroidia bacterium]MDW8014684.1 tetratricopeptide repeat protein [Bacteroidia bacterium]
MRWGWPLLSLGVALYLSCQGFQNSPPIETRYVGDSVCQQCHAEVSRAYRSTWKARSLIPITADLPRMEDFSQPAVYDPWKDFYYRAVWESDSLFLYEYRLSGKETVYVRRERLDFVIGSGHQTRSYLLWRNGFLYQAPLTWYEGTRRWGLSPGYTEGKNSRWSREIQPNCLACHASGWIAVPWTHNRYYRIGGAIGCESCHGPGSTHVKNPFDTTYFWRRWTPNQQMDACNRCHLEGIAIERQGGWEPGKALAAHWSVFLPERGELGRFGIASHSERLMRSACYQKGGATCMTCHHPHPTSPPPSYNNQCLSCHTRGCQNPRHPSDQCVSCHMPKGESSDVPHTRFTDHYIRVVRSEAQAPQEAIRLLCAVGCSSDPALLGEAYLKWYVEVKNEPWVLDTALRLLAGGERPASYAQALLLKGKPNEALSFAQKALRQDTTLHLLELYGYLLELTGQTEKALEVWKRLRARAPAYPDAAFRYVILSYVLGKFSAEETYQSLQTLVKEQPWNAQFHYNAAVLAAQLGRYSEAKQHLHAALQADPDYTPAREALRRLP